MTEAEPLVYFDISSPIEPRSYAPNPSKGRLALSFKCVPFKSTFVDLPDITETRKALGVPPGRTFDDGTEYYTLPMLQDPASGKFVGDSFEIATYLEETFPNLGGCLFPADSTHTGLDYESPNKDSLFMAPLSSIEGFKHQNYARFNQHVDATFSAHVIIVAEFMPFNLKSADIMKATFVKRAHLNSWDDLRLKGEARQQTIASFKEALTSLAQRFTVNEGGPYLEGEKANYADLIVGGWLNMLSICMPAEEWKDFRTWHGGVFARLHDSLQEHYFVCK